MKTYLYVRVSSAEQAGNGESLETQKEQLLAYAKSKKLQDCVIVEDAGVSASKKKTKNRRGWLQMFRQLREGDVVVATKVDRLFRSVADAATTVAALKKKKVQLHLVDKNGLVAGSINDELSFNIVAAVAQFDSQLKSERIAEVKQSMKRRGLWIGGLRMKGFAKRKIDGVDVAVADESERWILEEAARYAKNRVKEMKEHGRRRASKYTAQTLRKKLIAEAEKRVSKSTGGIVVGNRMKDYKKRYSTTDKKKIEELQRQGKDFIVNVQRFGLATLQRLMDLNSVGNAVERLKKMDALKKKVVVVDGELKRAKRRKTGGVVRQKSLGF